MSATTPQIDWNQIISGMVTVQMVNAMFNAMQNAFSGGGGFSGVTKVLEDVLPIIILVKLFEKMG